MPRGGGGNLYQDGNPFEPQIGQQAGGDAAGGGNVTASVADNAKSTAFITSMLAAQGGAGGSVRATLAENNALGGATARLSAQGGTSNNLGGQGFGQTSSHGPAAALGGAVTKASATASGQTADADAYAVGGTGGAGGIGTADGNGGAVSGTHARAVGVASASAEATQLGGAGGGSLQGGAWGIGGNGASRTLVNAVSGSTQGGTLTLMGLTDFPQCQCNRSDSLAQFRARFSNGSASPYTPPMPPNTFQHGWDAAIQAAREWHEAKAKQALVQARRERFPKRYEQEADFHQRAAEGLATLSPDDV